jgi:hypothetical protein
MGLENARSNWRCAVDSVRTARAQGEHLHGGHDVAIVEMLAGKDAVWRCGGVVVALKLRSRCTLMQHARWRRVPDRTSWTLCGLVRPRCAIDRHDKEERSLN